MFILRKLIAEEEKAACKNAPTSNTELIDKFLNVLAEIEDILQFDIKKLNIKKFNMKRFIEQFDEEQQIRLQELYEEMNELNEDYLKPLALISKDTASVFWNFDKILQTLKEILQNRETLEMPFVYELDEKGQRKYFEICLQETTDDRRKPDYIIKDEILRCCFALTYIAPMYLFHYDLRKVKEIEEVDTFNTKKLFKVVQKMTRANFYKLTYCVKKDKARVLNMEEQREKQRLAVQAEQERRRHSVKWVLANWLLLLPRLAGITLIGMCMVRKTFEQKFGKTFFQKFKEILISIWR